MSITINNLTVTYPYDEYPVIENLNLQINNKITTLLIDCQSGKGTLAKAIMGLVKYKGDITIDGQLYNNVKLKDRQVVYFTNPPLLFLGRSVQYNVDYANRVRKVDKVTRTALTKQALNKTQLNGVVKTKVKQLTPAQQVVVTIARAMTRKVKVIILDSCSEFFDSHAMQLIMDLQKDNDAYIINLTANLDNSMGEIMLIQHNKLLATGDKEQIASVKKDLLWLNDEGGANSNE